MKLSIIIPVFNEQKTLPLVIQKLKSQRLPGVVREIIIVDDGSTDSTPAYIQQISKKSTNIHSFFHTSNKGKGAAISTALQYAKGDYILIQDADLEYDPSDIPNLLKPVTEGKAIVVFGTRLKRLPNFTKDERTLQFFIQYLGNKALSLITAMLYGHMLTDMETGYKLFPKKALRGTKIKAKSFDFEPEITIKLLKKGYKIHEVVIKTNPRGYSEGKKLRVFRDGFQALYTIVKYKFSS
jgi:dolichol-phosphate mannosyltransferase